MDTATLHKRGHILREIRSFFHKQGFLEVETPLLLPANAPEEYIDPVFAGKLQLQTSPELCMKRLLSRGFRNIFQISKCWRSGERGSRHLPEFTMLEWYRADADYHTLMDDCRNLLIHIASKSIPDGLYRWHGLEIDPDAEWHEISVHGAFSEYASSDSIEAASDGSFDELLVTMIEPAIARFRAPVILMDYPAKMAALSRRKKNDGRFAERFELYIGGLELANGFSELNEPDEQMERFVESNSLRAADGRTPLPIPDTFIRELSTMPDSAGIALGVDRLVMLATGLSSIDDVVSFTPEAL